MFPKRLVFRHARRVKVSLAIAFTTSRNAMAAYQCPTCVFPSERCGSRDSGHVARICRACTRKRALLIDSLRPRPPVIDGNYEGRGVETEKSLASNASL